MNKRSLLILAVSWVCVVGSSVVFSTDAIAATKPISGVVGDDNSDAYIGTGGLLLPTSFSGPSSTKRKVASCLGCVWKYTTYCASDSTDMCAHAVATCPTGQIRYRVWFGASRETVDVIGSVCWGSHIPATRRQIEDRLDDLVVRRVPELHIACDPPDDTLTSIPIVCFTTQPTQFKPSPFTLANHTVRVTATAKWHWVWGDGDAFWKAIPGRAYPATQISHRYRVSGDYTVHVTSVWSASYAVTGVGTFTVGGDIISQDAHLSVAVHSAKTLRSVTK